jgi:transcriptional/translational regulatory protein YebC/TACO1
MSGHSKWNNIKRKKEKTDGQKGEAKEQDKGAQEPFRMTQHGITSCL